MHKCLHAYRYKYLYLHRHGQCVLVDMPIIYRTKVYGKLEESEDYGILVLQHNSPPPPKKHYFALVCKPNTTKFNSNPQWDQYIQRKGVTILLVRDIKTLSSNGDMQPLAHQTKCTHILFQEVESSIKPVITSHKPTLVCTSQYIGMLVDIDYCLDCSYW